MKNILFLHQSAELYGSDKTILLFISNLDKTKYNPIVILPFEGPLKTELERNNITVIIAPILKLYRKMFTPKGLLNFYKEYKEGMKMLKELHIKYNFALVYSHTLAVLIGILFAKKYSIKHLWHVQEILAKPVVINKAFKKILNSKHNHKVIYDSKETMRFWIEGDVNLTQKSDFIWNALDVSQMNAIPQEAIEDVRKNHLKVDKDTIVIALVGRINSWKGQPLLLEAFNILQKKHNHIKLAYIGAAPPNQEFFEDDLREKISSYELNDKVTIIPFQLDIHPFWAAIDIAVVPSTEPEPFGMVAIEAMFHQKPVVAANHGGLTEIVIPNETGFLFQNNDVDSLVSSIEELIKDEQERILFGINGKRRVHETFSMDKHVEKFEKVFEELIES